MSKISCLFLLFVFCSILILANENDDAVKVLEKANGLSDFSKKSYDHKEAVNLNKSILDNSKLHLHIRLDACFAICQLYLYRCKSQDRNEILAQKFLEMYILLCDGKLSRHISFIKTYYVEILKGNKKEIEFIKTYTWANYAFFNMMKSESIIYPYMCNTKAHKSNYMLEISRFLTVTQDTLIEKFIDLRGKDKNKFNLASGIIDELKFTALKDKTKNKYRMKALKLILTSNKPAIIKQKNVKEMEEKEELVISEYTELDEKSKAHQKKIMDWVAQDKKNHAEICRFLDKEVNKLLQTELGKEKIKKFFEDRKKMWKSSPIEWEITGLIKKINDGK